MRYHEFYLLIENALSEIKQSPSALQKFADSDSAQGMMAGFEAELIFSGLGQVEESDLEPDYDENTTGSSIEEIVDFFRSGPYSDMSLREAERLTSQLQDSFFDWMAEQISENWDNGDDKKYLSQYLKDEDAFDFDEAKKEIMKDQDDDLDVDVLALLMREKFDEYVREIMKEGWGNSYYEAAHEQYREEQMNELDEDLWISENQMTMMDIASDYNLSWPFMTEDYSDDTGYNMENAERLADDLSKKLGVKTKASDNYHQERRDSETWIFEPDSSLDGEDPDNMPLEIISPPMPLSQAVEIIPKFFEWAKDNDAYTNESTGFHMSVSMPDHAAQKLDFTKLALFLGDEYVLKQFGRIANTYTKSAIEKIKDRKSPEAVQSVLGKMRDHLDQFAARSLAVPAGFGKYTSINPKDGYVEFRSAGGENYMEDLKRLQNTLLRYSQALNVAMDPQSNKQEYAKKLYKLLTDVKTQQITDPKTGTKRTEAVSEIDNNSIELFSRFVAGELSKDSLLKSIKQIQQSRSANKNLETGEKIVWKVKYASAGIEVVASSEQEAKSIAAKEWGIINVEKAISNMVATPLRKFTNSKDKVAPPSSTAIDDPNGKYVIRLRDPRVSGGAGMGNVLFRFDADDDMNATEIARKWAETRGMSRPNIWLEYASRLPQEVLNSTSSNSTGVEFAGQWIIKDAQGREIHRFGGIGNSQGDANLAAVEWLRDNPSQMTDGMEVVPVMR